MPDAARHIIYVSSVVPDAPVDTFARICAGAREHNATVGISGVLLYDGQRFAQWLHGPDAAVAALMQRIVADPRHEHVVVLLEEVVAAAPPPVLWRAGFTSPEVLPAFAARMTDPEADAVREFMQLLPVADLWPPVTTPSAAPPTSGSCGA